MANTKYLINVYLHEIDMKLHISKARKKIFLTRLKSDIYQFCEDDPNLTMEKLYERFGTPDEIVEDYYENIDIDDIKKKLSNKKLNRSAICLAIFLIAVITIIWILLAVTYDETDIINTTTNYYYNSYKDFNNSLNN